VLITVINPNTSREMTSTIESSARAVAGTDTVVRAVRPSMGPASVESYYDEALAVPGVLAEIAAGEQLGSDGYVIACFGDPGLYAARELARGPVVGIAEAAMHAASFLGTGFSVVTTLDRTKGQAWHIAERSGMARFCRGVHACDIAPLDLDTDPLAVKRVSDACAAALERDGSDVIVLGCSGMSAWCAQIGADIGAPVVDGVSAAVLQVQSLVTMGLRTGDRGEFAAPPPKPYDGLLHEFGLPARLTGSGA
jgi:allantoin racemase